MNSLEKLRRHFSYYLNKIILIAIGMLCLFYSLYKARFAELHINISFLDFPIFIGEIILGICTLLFIIRLFLTNTKSFKNTETAQKPSAEALSGFDLSPQKAWIIIFFVFVLFKALYGYSKWGPLAFRNAALFYYVFFAVLTYYAFNLKFFKAKLIRYTLLALFLSIIFLMLPRASVYYYFDYCVFILLFSSYFKPKIFKYIFIVLVVCFSCIFLTLLTNGRDVLLSTLVSYIFLVTIWLVYFLKINAKYKIIFIVSIVSIIGFLFLKFSDKVTFRSIFNFKQHLSAYRKSVERVEDKKYFEPLPSPVRLYHPEDEVKELFGTTTLPKSANDKKIIGFISKYFPTYKTFQSKIDRSLPEAQENVVWRLLIWKDMLEELFENKNVLGLDFGKPFRSINAQAMGLSSGGWVGWIEPHNSYVHILYRAGIIGLLFIVALWGLFIRIFVRFVRNRNIKGILLSSAVFYWLVISNFSVILEVPYFAIPFWSLLGITYGYYKQTL
jgi:hypothetical protein